MELMQKAIKALAEEHPDGMKKSPKTFS